jgi:hypothetical protein
VFVRNIALGPLLESFFVSAVTALLAIRFYLQVTGFPQLGGGGLHIAHMLWGGSLMLIALVLLLAFLGRRIQHAAAILGGAGFGTFIDELGKFITSDNNYFFQPTIALIYVIFVLLFLVFRSLATDVGFTERESLANALDMVKEAVIQTGRPSASARTLRALTAASAQAPAIAAVLDMVDRADGGLPDDTSVFARIANHAALLYRRLTHSRWFTHIVVAGCIGYALLYTLGSTLLALALLRGTATMARISTLETDVIVVILSALGAGLLLVVGVLALPRSRLTAYLWFKRGVLVSILVGQPFLFYQQHLGALSELALNFVVLSTLNYMIHCEQDAMGNRIPPEQGKMNDRKAAQAVQTPDQTSKAVP